MQNAKLPSQSAEPTALPKGEPHMPLTQGEVAPKVTERVLCTLTRKCRMQNAECKIEVKARSEKSCRIFRFNEKTKKCYI